MVILRIVTEILDVICHLRLKMKKTLILLGAESNLQIFMGFLGLDDRQCPTFQSQI